MNQAPNGSATDATNTTTNQLTKTICVLASTLQQVEQRLEDKHAQWQAAVRLGAAERKARQSTESALREHLADLAEQIASGLVEYASEAAAPLRKILAGVRLDATLPYPTTSEGDWRNAFGQLMQMMVVLGWEPADFDSLQAETNAACDFLQEIADAIMSHSVAPQHLSAVSQDTP